MLDHAGESYPDALAHTLSLLHAMDNDRAYERLYACYRQHDLSFAIDDELTPFLFALRMYLHAPEILRDEHAHAAIPHVSTYAYYQTSLLPDECVREKPSDALLDTWTDDLNNWMIANQKGAGTRIVCCQEDNTFFFVIQHGGHMKCENVMKKGSGGMGMGGSFAGDGSKNHPAAGLPDLTGSDFGGMGLTASKAKFGREYTCTYKGTSYPEGSIVEIGDPYEDGDCKYYDWKEVPKILGFIEKDGCTYRIESKTETVSILDIVPGKRMCQKRFKCQMYYWDFISNFFGGSVGWKQIDPDCWCEKK